ncbi:MAG TPA: RHS repeat-associated core domain-containing protein, partial [Leptospiraceae bacterium]|nr:RHS repeat-associated core domain-containing protein [Leptospiraceae bacterium]
MDGLVGVHIYITNQVSSNHLVTDTNGRLVCKYVYEPYGKMNMNLTDTDPDKDGVQFIALKKFTGQEYDYETGLYNYNARLYDQETGRFLQP